MKDEPIGVGDTVEVNVGVNDPAIEKDRTDGAGWASVSLAGWRGTVAACVDRDDGSRDLLIEWDSRTLRNTPPYWHRYHVTTSYDYFAARYQRKDLGSLWLSRNQVHRVPPGDTRAERAAALQNLERELRWREVLDRLHRVAGHVSELDWRGDVQWTVRTLRAPLMAQALRGHLEEPGLNRLREISRTHDVEFREGALRRNGTLCTAHATSTITTELRQQGLGTLLVIARWVQDDGFEKLVFETEVVVGVRER